MPRLIRLLLITIVILLVLTAILAIAELRFGGAIYFVLVTANSVALSLAVLACAFAYQAGRARPFMMLGIVCGIAALIMVTIRSLIQMLAMPFQIGPAMSLAQVLADPALRAGVNAVTLIGLLAAHWAILSLVPVPVGTLRTASMFIRWLGVIFIAIIGISQLPMMPFESAAVVVCSFPLVAAGAMIVTVYLWLSGLVKRRRWVLHVGTVGLTAALVVTLHLIEAMMAPIHSLYRYATQSITSLVELYAIGGAMLIALTATLLTLVWMHWLDARDRILNFNLPLRFGLTCPVCAHAFSTQPGSDMCPNCKLIVRITAEEPRCACGYALSNIPSDRCPECGRVIAVPGSAQ